MVAAAGGAFDDPPAGLDPEAGGGSRSGHNLDVDAARAPAAVEPT
ncbi:hypothetical protein [Mycobacterium sp. SM1]|nr:hypothetical protein [Mycobacterium sp. SM1]